MGRSPCCFEKGLKKGPWTQEEDRKLIDYIHKHGHGSWSALPELAGLNRCGKSCRLRWTNYLRPDIKRGRFSDEEEQIIIHLHSLLGNKWSRIAAHLPGRTDNEIKNQWNTHLRKKLLQRGIDPKTHKPLSDLNSFANLSQFLSASSLGNLMNPNWDNAFRSQVDFTQVVQIQLLQSIVQLINTTPFQNIAENLLLGPHNIAQFEGVSTGATTTIYIDTDPPQAPFDYPNLGVNPQLFNNFPAATDSVESIEGGFQPEALGVDYSSLQDSNYYNQIENTLLPTFVSASVESSTVNQLERNFNPVCLSPHSPTSNFFEAWEKFLDDEENTSWKDILPEAFPNFG